MTLGTEGQGQGSTVTASLWTDSLKKVAWEAQATPGLKQLTRVFAIQLQVLNGADNLGVHVADSHLERERCRWDEVGCGKKDRNPTVNYAPLERKGSSTTEDTVYTYYISDTHVRTHKHTALQQMENHRQLEF